ncbi:chaperone modulator CbpM [Variovorax sp. LT2P21]|uniref:chaperone modulator CbpM n=1 Tax=Variovorax sp. LT2P21 TaxID=3443731 RepID=UPI003F470596
MAAVSVTTTALGLAHPLAAHELAHACGAEIEWVVQLVEVGIVELSAPSLRPDDWRFQSTDLQQALAARRLERDFGVGLDAAALILDLQREVRRLKAVLHAQGLSPGH